MVGKKTIDLLETRLESLIACANSDGSIDYERYFSEIQIPLIPSGIGMASGKEFLSSLLLVFDEVAEYVDDPISSKILRERLSKPPRQRETLDQIAQCARPTVTRERIR